MKPNELMIDDWVEFNSESMEQIIKTQVKQISKDCIRTYATSSDDIYEEDIEPIPLTAKILEKNRFEHRHRGEPIKRQYWILRYDGGSVKVKINRGLLYFEITGISVKAGYFAPCFYGHIEYVHELQHSLRDCRLKGLADNFIV